MSWDKIRLADCCVSISDGDHQPPPKAPIGIPFVTISNINAYHQFDFSDTMFVPQDYYDNLDDKRKAHVGDVLYSVVGSFGIPVLIQEEKPFVFQRHIAILRPDSDRILPEFLFYTMLSRNFYAVADSVAVGAAQKTIGLSALRDIKISVPPIEEQNRIVGILSDYDNLINNNQKQIKLLEEAAQRLYKEWFINLRFPGYEETPIVDGVPEGWSKRPLKDITCFIRGKSYSSSELDNNSGILMVNLKSIRPFGGYRRNEEKRYIGKYKNEQLLNAGDIVMGVTDMTKERRLVGHVALIPDFDEPVTFSMDLIKLIPFDVPRSYLYSTMQYGGISNQIAQLANGVNVLHLKPEAIMDIDILIPSDNVMKAYDDLFVKQRVMIDKLQSKCNLAQEARDRLLPKLMSGEIVV